MQGEGSKINNSLKTQGAKEREREKSGETLEHHLQHIRSGESQSFAPDFSSNSFQVKDEGAKRAHPLLDPSLGPCICASLFVHGEEGSLSKTHNSAGLLVLEQQAARRKRRLAGTCP